ncbi:hypothetical protein [Lysobacter sp. Root667]|uniref:hypothetical protein n=1 Tax=Lysobacter sp. Root667 TaxID=1736581 RepID=UPI0012DC0838|nr:hypothetical protein [Lysobacter sp. Root667]
MFEITYKKLLSVALVAFVSLACGCEGYPGDATVKNDFLRLAKVRVPSEIDVAPTVTYRADGDYKSFSQVVVYEATARKEVAIKHGWLKGVVMRNGQVLSDRKVEFLYNWSDGRWLLVDDGPLNSSKPGNQ